MEEAEVEAVALGQPAGARVADAGGGPRPRIAVVPRERHVAHAHGVEPAELVERVLDGVAALDADQHRELPLRLGAAHLGRRGGEGDGGIHARAERDADLGMAAGLAPCRGLAGVVDVRVTGAIGVVELGKINDLVALKKRFVEAGVWIRPFGNIVYLTPALNMAVDDAGLLTQAVVKVLSD